MTRQARYKYQAPTQNQKQKTKTYISSQRVKPIQINIKSLSNRKPLKVSSERHRNKQIREF